jgi:hypothetical protein
MNCSHLGKKAIYSRFLFHPHRKIERCSTKHPRKSATKRKPTYPRAHATPMSRPEKAYAWRKKQGADAHNKIHKKKTTKT